MPAAIASECADDQGKFWEYHDILFQRQSMWKILEIDRALYTFKEYASELNLNQNEFELCLDSEKYLDEANQDLNDGQNNKVTGTPIFFIGNDEIDYTSMVGAKSFSDFASVIDGKLNER